MNAKVDDAAYKKLGKRYRRLRLKKGLTQEDVMKYGFSVRHYQQLEAGKSHTLTTLFKLAEMFGTTASKLVKNIFD